MGGSAGAGGGAGGGRPAGGTDGDGGVYCALNVAVPTRPPEATYDNEVLIPFTWREAGNARVFIRGAVPSAAVPIARNHCQVAARPHEHAQDGVVAAGLQLQPHGGSDVFERRPEHSTHTSEGCATTQHLGLRKEGRVQTPHCV
jgi:hypothetical protein